MIKCEKCGYLSVRHYQSRQLVEVELCLRKTGEQPDIPHSGHKPYEDSPICFVQACAIHRERQFKTPDDLIAVISQNRECDCFTEWNQDYSPREHLDMNLLQRQEARAKSDRAEDLKLSRDFARDLSDKAQRVSVRLCLISGVIGFAAAMAAVALGSLLR